MPRSKSYATRTKENLSKLADLSKELQDFDLFQALIGKDMTHERTFEILWDRYKDLVKNDKTPVGTDKRTNLGSIANANYKRWKQISKWAKDDSSSKYGNFYAEETQMLEWYLTEGLIDVLASINE